MRHSMQAGIRDGQAGSQEAKTLVPPKSVMCPVQGPVETTWGAGTPILLAVMKNTPPSPEVNKGQVRNLVLHLHLVERR